MLTATVVDDLDHLTRLEDEWSELLRGSEADAPALSPTWQLAWWRVFGDGFRSLRVAAFRDQSELVGLMPMVGRTVHDRMGIALRRLEPLGSGEDREEDEIGSDYLGMIAKRGYEDQVANSLAELLGSDALGTWDELVLPTMNGATRMPVRLAGALASHGYEVGTRVTNASPYIPLPDTWEAYLAALSASKRAYLRRSLRQWDEWCANGAQLHRATTLRELEEGKRVLADLHGERWAAAGKSGVFASDRFNAFHDQVMPQLLRDGALDLSWTTVRGRPMAAIYNIRWAKTVHFYQSGRSVDVPSSVRPGIALHAQAIQRAIALGEREYDFLPGASRYKMSLALATRPIVQLRAARPSLREVGHRASEIAVDMARWCKRHIVQRTWSSGT